MNLGVTRSNSLTVSRTRCAGTLSCYGSLRTRMKPHASRGQQLSVFHKEYLTKTGYRRAICKQVKSRKNYEHQKANECDIFGHFLPRIATNCTAQISQGS